MVFKRLQRYPTLPATRLQSVLCPEKIVENDFLLDDAAVDIMPYTFSGDHRQNY